jgi:hypothetical protein
MNRTIVFAAFALGALAGCMGGPPRPAAGPSASGPPVIPDPSMRAADSGPLGSPFADPRGNPAALQYPLILDATDMRYGATIQYARIPSVTEIHDLQSMSGVQRLVISLPAWPASYEPLQPLEQLSQDYVTTVIVPGYPPSRQAAEAWNLLNVPIRLIVVVNEPPSSALESTDLNNLRALERVIAQVDAPNRYGFEHLQRPISYRVLKE